MPHLGLFPRDHHTLFFHQPPTTHALKPLPRHITRTNIYPSTPEKHLELLTAHPPPSSPSNHKPQTLLFIHGGFGSASVWLPFLDYFSQRGYVCYAISLRGHGESWKLGYMEMVFCTGLRDMAADENFAVKEVGRIQKAKKEDWSEQDLVVIGHSAGGGVSQYLLSEMGIKVGGLILLASFPNFGGWRTYWNWGLLDPLFLVRWLFRDLTHSRSPLSSTSLVHRAFFLPAFPIVQVQEFEKNMAEYESLLWPSQMMFRFTDVSRVLSNILGWDRSRKLEGEKEGGVGQRMLVIAGEGDMIVKPYLMSRTADEYREARRTMIKDADVSTEAGIKFEIVRGGHHVQNDVYWEECAQRIFLFLEQL